VSVAGYTHTQAHIKDDAGEAVRVQAVRVQAVRVQAVRVQAVRVQAVRVQAPHITYAKRLLGIAGE